MAKPLTGIVWMLVGVAAFAFMHAIIKSLTGVYPPMQLAALRGWFALPIVLAWALADSERTRLLHVRWRLQVARGLSTLLAGTGAIVALRYLPLADAYTISFSAPLIVATLSSPALGEGTGTRRWIALATGFIGVLIVLCPNGDPMLSLGGVAMVASALGYAGGVLGARALARTDTALAIVLWTTVVICIGAGLLAMPSWVPIHAAHVPRLMLIGALGVAGQFAVVAALRLASAPVIVPFEYTALIWAVTFDWIFWHHKPTSAAMLGGALIVAAGGYLIWSEHRSWFDSRITVSRTRTKLLGLG